MLTIQEIRAALDRASHQAAAFTPDARHCAVAMILAPGERELEACFIRRAERHGDPWAGQVAFPGGRADATDASASAVAERETHEEVGLRLHTTQRIGALPTHAIRSNMTLSPFIYYLAPRADQPSPQQIASPRETHEVASVFWVPLSHLFDTRSTTTLDYPPGELATSFPGIGYGEHVIWGLTLRVLETFAELVERRLPALA